jgi:ADP-ribose pyrophosphatase
MNKWKCKKRRTILAHSKYLRVDEHEVELGDGSVIPDWPVVITPDYVNILAQDSNGYFVFFHQQKYMAPDMRISPPGGYIEPGEDPLAGAKRELLEETGYASELWIDLGRYIVDSNRGCGTAHLFLAMDSKKITEAKSDDLEEQTLVLLTRAELELAIDKNFCPILSATALFTLSLRHLDRNPAA